MASISSKHRFKNCSIHKDVTRNKEFTKIVEIMGCSLGRGGTFRIPSGCLGERSFSHLHLDLHGGQKSRELGASEANTASIGSASSLICSKLFSFTSVIVSLSDEVVLIARMSMLCSRLGSSHVSFPSSLARRGHRTSRITTLAFSTSLRTQHALETASTKTVSQDNHISLAREIVSFSSY